MKKIALLLGLATLPFAFCHGQATQATLLDNWNDPSVPPTNAYNNPYNECWGIAVNGHEYGVIGSTLGLHFIDVTNPTDVFEAFMVPGASSGTNVIHRDMKDYNGYLYCVADEGPSELQVIDIQNLPNSVTEVYSSNEFVTRAHNLYIDTFTQRLYLFGAGSSTKVLDISNPTQPALLASYPNASFYMPYTHDGFVENNIGFFNCGNSGFWVVDFTDPLAPVQLSVLTAYTDAGYNHSGWLSEDGNYYFLCDETHGARVKVLDVTDLSEPVEVATIEPGLWNNEIPHNCLVRGNYLYFSYYFDGLEVWDISDPENPSRAYFYDTYPGSNVPSYAGAWGVNPNLPSGNILLSDMQGGLFIFASVDGTPNINLIPSEDVFDICLGETVNFNLSVGPDFSANGVTLSALPGSLQADVQFNPNPAPPGSSVAVTVSNIGSTLGQPQDLVVLGTDGTSEKTTTISVAANEVPAAPSQVSPAENALAVPLTPTFEWQPVAAAASYKLQIADELANFDANVVYSANLAATSFTLLNSLQPGKTYYWRISSKNDCGQTPSAVRTFTTEGVNAVGNLLGATVQVYPNPATEQVTLALSTPLAFPVGVAVSTPSGQLVRQQMLGAGASSLSLPVAELPAGLYLLRLSSEGGVLVEKLVIE